MGWTESSSARAARVFSLGGSDWTSGSSERVARIYNLGSVDWDTKKAADIYNFAGQDWADTGSGAYAARLFSLASGGDWTAANYASRMYALGGQAWDADTVQDIFTLGSSDFSGTTDSAARLLALAGQDWTTGTSNERVTRIYNLGSVAWTTTEAGYIFELAAADPATQAITYVDIYGGANIAQAGAKLRNAADNADACGGTLKAICQAAR